MNRSTFLIFAFTCAFSLAECECESKSLSFEEAKIRALNGSPDLRVEFAEIGVQDAERVQSELYFNPIFSYSVENVFGTRDWSGWKSAESRYELSQLIQIGGQRGYLTAAATWRTFAAEANYAASQFYMFNRLAKAFLNAAAQEQLLMLAEAQKKTSEEIVNVVTQKIKTGKVSETHGIKSSIALANAELQLENAVMNFDVAKVQLAAIWGSACLDFDLIEYPFFEIRAPRCFQECLSDIENHPAFVSVQFEQLAIGADVCYEKSVVIPDIVLTAGYKTINREREKGMILGAAIPLPLFDRNQGNIQKACTRSQKIRDLLDATQIRLEVKLISVYKELEVAYQRACKFKERILAMAERSFQNVKSGYEEGKFEYLDLLDAQTTLFESQQTYIETLLEYHTKCVDLEYLTIQEG